MRSWYPLLAGTNPTVETLALSGDSVYVGGQLTGITGLDGGNLVTRPRENIGEIPQYTPGNSRPMATDWNPGANGFVEELNLSGSTVYAGGEFNQVGGQDRNYLAAIDATSGVTTSWAPGLLGDDSANEQRFFHHGLRIERLRRWSVQRGRCPRETTWPRSTMRRVKPPPGTRTPTVLFSISPSPDRPSTPEGISPRSAASPATTSRRSILRQVMRTAWNPDADGWVRTLDVSDGTVYAGGEFGQIGGQSRSKIAALSASTGDATVLEPGCRLECA